jgi:hypothetical protein
MNVKYLNNNIINIVISYNKNKKLYLLNEILESTQYINSFLNDDDYHNRNNDWSIFRNYNDVNEKYYWDLIPKLIQVY